VPTELGPPYPKDWRGDPRHMLKRDVPVWYRFLEKYGAPFLTIYYDVLLGGPFLSEEEKKDPLKRDWQVLTSKRADVIVELAAEIWVIEVVHVAGMRSLGQTQAYFALWSRDPKIDKPPRMVLVAETIDEDLLDAAGVLGVSVFIV